MKSSFHILVIAAAILLALPAFAQTSASPATVPCKVPPPPPKPQAYSAELKTTTVQTLVDGTTITRESTETRAQDSERRTMSTNTVILSPTNMPTYTNTNVNDPVEGTQTSWNSQTKKARITKIPPADQRYGCWATESGNFRMNYGKPRPAGLPGIAAVTAVEGPAQLAPQPAVTASIFTRNNFSKPEDLGTESILGVEVHGTRSTWVTPVGQIGNDRPITHTTENWSAPGFGFPFRTIYDDPQSGKRTSEVVRLDLSEPPPETFQPPEGYQVTTEEMHEVPCAQQ
jgi:hypothetical protein